MKQLPSNAGGERARTALQISDIETAMHQALPRWDVMFDREWDRAEKRLENECFFTYWIDELGGEGAVKQGMEFAYDGIFRRHTEGVPVLHDLPTEIRREFDTYLEIINWLPTSQSQDQKY